MNENIFHDKFKRLGFLSITGNLDNEIQSILLNLEWQKSKDNNVPIFFLIIDDPFCRWARLVCDQYCKSNHSNKNLNEDDFLDFLLYNKINCKEFTTLQANIYQESKIFETSKKIHFLKLDQKIGYTLNHLLHEYNIPNKFNNSLRLNQSIDSHLTKLENFLHNDTNLPYLNKVMKYLDDDYDFINSIEFYAR